VVRDGLSPRLVPDLTIASITIPDQDSPGLAVGVPRSLAAPHAVWFERSGKFYRRSESDKYQANVDEIRRMVLESDRWRDDARRFCAERIKHALSDEADVRLNAAARTFVHILPVGHREEMIDLAARQQELENRSREAMPGGYTRRYNFDGFLVYQAGDNAEVRNYIQWFRYGGIQTCTAWFHSSVDQGAYYLGEFGKWFPSWVKEMASFLWHTLAVNPPFSLHVTLLDLRGRTPGTLEPSWTNRLFSRDRLGHSFVITHADDNLRRQCEETVILLWQSAGFAGPPRR
jgi:hypothetical protein